MANTNSPIVSSLPSYVNSNRNQLLAKAVLGARTRRFVTLQTGVKKVAQLNLLNTSIVFRQASCDFEATSSQTLSARNITCGNFAVDIQWCDKRLLGKWAEYQVKIAADKTASDLPFEESFIADFIANINVEADKAYWQGDVTHGSGNLALNDGIITILSAISPSIEVNEASTATKIAQVNAAVLAIPAAAKAQGVCRLFMAPEYYEAWMLELVAANLYHYRPSDGEDEYTIPGTKVIATSVPGLTGAKHIVGGNTENFFWGTDLENDEETLDLWYSKDNRAFRGVVEFNLGAQVAFPDQVAFVKIKS